MLIELILRKTQVRLLCFGRHQAVENTSPDSYGFGFVHANLAASIIKKRLRIQKDLVTIDNTWTKDEKIQHQTLRSNLRNYPPNVPHASNQMQLFNNQPPVSGQTTATHQQPQPNLIRSYSLNAFQHTNPQYGSNIQTIPSLQTTQQSTSNATPTVTATTSQTGIPKIWEPPTNNSSKE
jgi:hypothetical protein